MKPNVYGFIPQENLIDLPFSCKLVVDPDNTYFNENIKKDRESHLKMILIHGCEPKVVNNITKEIIENQKYFDKIFTYDIEVLKNKFVKVSSLFEKEIKEEFNNNKSKFTK